MKFTAEGIKVKYTEIANWGHRFLKSQARGPVRAKALIAIGVIKNSK